MQNERQCLKLRAMGFETDAHARKLMESEALEAQANEKRRQSLKLCQMGLDVGWYRRIVMPEGFEGGVCASEILVCSRFWRYWCAAGFVLKDMKF